MNRYAVVCVAFSLMAGYTLHAQSKPETKLEFEVASVKPNLTNETPHLNVSPTPNKTGFVRTGGLYSGKNIVLVSYISFAYNLTNQQLRAVTEQAPWTAEERFDIEAHAQGDPTKDEYRAMMRSLLEDRFKLKARVETRDVPMYALVLEKPDKLGPHLRLHRADDPICTAPSSSWDQGTVDEDGFPKYCGDILMKPSVPGRFKTGGRDISMQQFAAIITGVGQVNYPMVDRTGIKGTVDYTLEWKQIHPGAESGTDDSAPLFERALKEQLGLKMMPTKGPAELFVIDHIERPSPN